MLGLLGTVSEAARKRAGMRFAGYRRGAPLARKGFYLALALLLAMSLVPTAAVSAFAEETTTQPAGSASNELSSSEAAASEEPDNAAEESSSEQASGSTEESKETTEEEGSEDEELLTQEDALENASEEVSSTAVVTALDAEELQPLEAPDTYNTDDIAAINSIITTHGLSWDLAPVDGSEIPANWVGNFTYTATIWSGTLTNKRLLSLDLTFQGISGVLDVSTLGTLTTLRCGGNQISTLILPSTLRALFCATNQLSELPPLPPELRQLHCGVNQLSELPPLPDRLEQLDCEQNRLSELPPLPPTLKDLGCSINELTSLPSLPEGLLELVAAINQLTSLPELPSSLVILNCDENNLSSLPALPDSLVALSCRENQLMSLSPLPEACNYIDCAENQLKSLPPIPEICEYLDCSENQLSSLPPLPEWIFYLYCQGNHLTEMSPTTIHPLGEFEGGNQSVTLTLTGNESTGYSLALPLNNPSGLAEGIGYANSMLTSISSSITSTPFAVVVNSSNAVVPLEDISAQAAGDTPLMLSGTMALLYQTSQAGTTGSPASSTLPQTGDATLMLVLAACAVLVTGVGCIRLQRCRRSE